MYELRAGSSEAQFADLIWENEPIASGALAALSKERWQWAKTTAFTVLKRLCDKGIFRNENGMVTSVLSREECYAVQSEKFVEKNFGGSLPAFVAAFTSRRKLSPKEVEELRRMVDSFEESE